MKKPIFCLMGIFLCVSLFAQDQPVKNYWTAGTAFTVQKHRWEPSLFALSPYGINDRLEIAAHPLMMFLIPQVQLKVGWGEHSGFRLASEHGVLYPSLFMGIVARKGIGGLISPELEIPQMVAIYNRFLVSHRILKNALLTGHAGVSFSLKSDRPDSRSTIDMPLIYPRFGVFYSQPGFDTGLDFRGNFSHRFGWDLAVQNFIFCGTPHNYFMENKGVVTCTSKKDRLRVEAGYKLCYGVYPDGRRWHLLPDINLIFAIGK